MQHWHSQRIPAILGTCVTFLYTPYSSTKKRRKQMEYTLHHLATSGAIQEWGKCLHSLVWGSAILSKPECYIGKCTDSYHWQRRHHLCFFLLFVSIPFPFIRDLPVLRHLPILIWIHLVHPDETNFALLTFRRFAIGYVCWKNIKTINKNLSHQVILSVPLALTCLCEIKLH